MQLILATKNKDKIKEIKSALQNLQVEILSFEDFDCFPKTIEDRPNLEENSEKKAREIWEKYHISSLADDTGLFVDALDGAPGVYSSRFAGENVTYRQNRQKLLKLLKDIPKQKRTATFRTVIVLITKNGDKIAVNGECRGYIGFEEKGEKGFGYDPIFYFNDSERTLAELSIEEKNKISHRGIALQKMRDIIAELFNSSPTHPSF